MRKRTSDITEVGEEVLRVLKRFPKLPSNTLAKKLHHDNPKLFPTIELARSNVRRYRGKNGALNRKRLTHTEHLERFDCPEPDIIDYEPYVLPDVCEHIGVMSDIHVPYHDKDAIEASVGWLLEHKVDTIILNGDIIDDYHFSDFVRDVNRRSAKGEFEMLVQFLKYLDHKFPNRKKIWKEGNHEERFPRYLKTRAPILWDVAALSIPDVLSMYYGYDLKLNGWEFVTDKKIIKAGSLNIIHGHEIPGGGNVNIARNLFLRTYDNVLKGHSHRKNDDIIKTIDGKFYGAWAVGCLCQLHAEWLPNNQWTHGFAYVKLNDDNTFMVANIQVINGHVV
jgi:predicted phosphodiesterase